MIRATTSGETFIVLSVSYDDTATCVREIRKIYQHLRALKHPGILSLRPALDSIAIEHTPDFHMDSLDLGLLEGLDNPEADLASQLRVPVCYDPALAPDLDSVLEQTGLALAELVDQHTSRKYRVWMLGFMPGFPYLGALPPGMILPRKARPAPRVPAGSVAIAEEFTGIYPFESPGGWHVIGRTPWKVTEYSRDNPFLFEYGMQVEFYPITIEEYGEIQAVRS